MQVMKIAFLCLKSVKEGRFLGFRNKCNPNFTHRPMPLLSKRVKKKSHSKFRQFEYESWFRILMIYTY